MAPNLEALAAPATGQNLPIFNESAEIARLRLGIAAYRRSEDRLARELQELRARAMESERRVAESEGALTEERRQRAMPQVASAVPRPGADVCALPLCEPGPPEGAGSVVPVGTYGTRQGGADDLQELPTTPAACPAEVEPEAQRHELLADEQPEIVRLCHAIAAHRRSDLRMAWEVRRLRDRAAEGERRVAELERALAEEHWLRATEDVTPSKSEPPLQADVSKMPAREPGPPEGTDGADSAAEAHLREPRQLPAECEARIAQATVQFRGLRELGAESAERPAGPEPTAQQYGVAAGAGDVGPGAASTGWGTVVATLPALLSAAEPPATAGYPKCYKPQKSARLASPALASAEVIKSGVPVPPRLPHTCQQSSRSVPTRLDPHAAHPSPLRPPASPLCRSLPQLLVGTATVAPHASSTCSKRLTPPLDTATLAALVAPLCSPRPQPLVGTATAAALRTVPTPPLTALASVPATSRGQHSHRSLGRGAAQCAMQRKEYTD